MHNFFNYLQSPIFHKQLIFSIIKHIAIPLYVILKIMLPEFLHVDKKSRNFTSPNYLNLKTTNNENFRIIKESKSII